MIAAPAHVPKIVALLCCLDVEIATAPQMPASRPPLYNRGGGHWRYWCQPLVLCTELPDEMRSSLPVLHPDGAGFFTKSNGDNSSCMRGFTCGGFSGLSFLGSILWNVDCF